MITLSSHGPYDLVGPHYAAPRFDGIKDRLLRDYLASMSYVDLALEEFVTRLGDVSRPYIFIVGDHAPYLNEGCCRETGLTPYFPAWAKLGRRETSFVPLLVRTPDGAARRENRLAAGFLDLAVTILEASRAPYSVRSFGQNLLAGTVTDDEIPWRDGSHRRRRAVPHGPIGAPARMIFRPAAAGPAGFTCRLKIR